MKRSWLKLLDKYVIEAVTLSKTQKQLKPKVENTGAIRGTQLQMTLRLKVGAKVMLTANVDTKDCLTNGTFGVVVGVEEKVLSDGKKKVATVLVEFTKERSGKGLRKKRPDLNNQYHGRHVTAIQLYEQEFTLSGKRTAGSATATAIQFPLRLAFAATSHKVQGMTVSKPNCLIVDLAARCQPAQGYVMLSRVQELRQLYILGKLPAHKLVASPKALKELERMESVCLNKDMKHPLFSSINVRSLPLHFPDMKSAPQVIMSDVICIQETWIQPGKHMANLLLIDGFTAHFNNVGKGKGIATYYREATFKVTADVTKPAYQMSKINSHAMSIINVYRSSNAPRTFIHDLENMIEVNQLTYIVGDFNIDYISQKDNSVVKKLYEIGFRQLVLRPTHMAGGLLDHIYTNACTDNIMIQQQSPYFSDHDILFALKMGDDN